MNIKFTKEEFKSLLDLVYAGNTVTNVMRDDKERIQEYDNIEQKIFSLAEEFDLKDVVVYDEYSKGYVPTRAYEASEINECIEDYDEAVFLEELIIRLARKDALNVLCDEKPDMSKEELARLQIELEDKYEKILLEGGVANLRFTNDIFL